MLRVVIITHGNFGLEMLRTAENIIGPRPDTVIISLNPNEKLGDLCSRVSGIIREIMEPEGVLVLTDMVGGTPCNACLPLCASNRLEVVSGINLYMLISAMMNCGKLQVEELAKKVVSDGKRNITDAKEVFIAKLGK